jgi:hypothetical protein
LIMCASLFKYRITDYFVGNPPFHYVAKNDSIIR